MIKDATYDIIENYGYDIGYYEGIRNTLQIIYHSFMMKELSEKEKIELLLTKIGNELDDAIRQQKNSEKILAAQY